MILQQQSGLSPFRTKKKSSDGSWAAWVSMLAVAVAASAAFGASEVLMMHSHTVKFMNLRTANLIDFRTDEVSNEAIVNAKTPLVFFMKDKVLFGSISSVIAPRTSQDILVLDKLTWKQDLENKMPDWKYMKSLFPSRVVAYGFEKEESAKNVFDQIQTLGLVFKKMNDSGTHVRGTPPVAVLVRIPWGE